MPDLRDRTLFITGASRGIGKAIALRAARDGARIVIAAKTVEPDPRVPGTIHTAAEEIRAAGGEALACAVDVRSEEAVQSALESAARTFGGIDIVVNNASAIFLAGTRETPMKRFDLMHSVNVRGTFLVSRLALPWLERSPNAHILNLSPPLSSDARWFAPHLAYTMSKMGMSWCVLGMAEELRALGVSVNALWPRTAIDTAAVRNLLGGEAAARRSRTADIVADAAHWILTQDSPSVTGRFFVDEDLLRDECGVTDFTRYAVDPTQPLIDDFFLDSPGAGD